MCDEQMFKDLFGVNLEDYNDGFGVDYGDDEDDNDEDNDDGDMKPHAIKYHNTVSIGKMKDTTLPLCCRPTKGLKNHDGMKIQQMTRAVSGSAGLSVSADAIGVVMYFLAPKELFRVAFTCKDLLQKVTAEMVVRSAMMSGGRAKAQMDDLYPLMKNQSIFVPSALRLLRLANAKRCEARLCTNGNQVIRYGWGVNLCWECLSVSQRISPSVRPLGFTMMLYKRDLKTRWDQKLAMQLSNNPRVAKNYHWYSSRKYLHFFNKRLVSTCGEAHGPFITVDEIDEVNAEQLDAAESELVVMKDAPDPQEYQPFVTAYESMVDEANLLEKRRGAMKDGFKELIEKIRMDLDDRWKDFILQFDIVGGQRSNPNIRRNTRNQRRPTIKFHVEFVGEMLKPYIRAPSKAKKGSLVANISNQINEKMDLANQFLDFEFMDNDDPFDIWLRERFCQMYSRPERLLDDIVKGKQRLQSGAALVRALHGGGRHSTIQSRYIGCRNLMVAFDGLLASLLSSNRKESNLQHAAAVSSLVDTDSESD